MTLEEKIEVVKILKAQDEVIQKLVAEREALKAKCREAKCYEEVWKMLFSDYESHFQF